MSSLHQSMSAGYLRSFLDLTKKNISKLATPDAAILG